MEHGWLARALRPAASLALLGAVASGCGLPGGYHGGGGGATSYYGSPGYYSSYSSYHRRDSRGHSSSPPKVNWSQSRLQQHWREQAQKVR